MWDSQSTQESLAHEVSHHCVTWAPGSPVAWSEPVSSLLKDPTPRSLLVQSHTHVLPTHVPAWYSNTPLPPATWKLMSLPRPRAPCRIGLPCIWAPHRAGGHPGRTAGTQEACANRRDNVYPYGAICPFADSPYPMGGTRTGGPSAQDWQITPGQTQHSRSTTLNFTLCFEADCVELQYITSWNWILYT